MAAIGSMRKKLSGFSEEGDDDYGSAGMYFNPSMFPPHRSDKEVGGFAFLCQFKSLFHSKRFKCKICVVVVSYPYYMNEK